MKEQELIKKANEWHKLIVKGLVNGLTHTSRDERRNDINWVRKRLHLFESFSRCIMNTIWENDNQYNEKELREVAEEGYSSPTNTTEKVIECPMKIKNVFPYGEIPIVNSGKLKEIIQKENKENSK